jgi:hypothetical protein
MKANADDPSNPGVDIFGCGGKPLKENLFAGVNTNFLRSEYR